MNLPLESLILVLMAIAFAILLLLGVTAVGVIRISTNLRDIAVAAARVRADSVSVTDETWRAIASQIGADVLNEPVRVDSFAGMVVNEEAMSTMRFVLHDHRVLVFSAGAVLCDSHRLDSRNAGELNAMWTYFASHTGDAVTLPRRWAWYALVTAGATSPGAHAAGGKPTLHWSLDRR